MAHTPDSRGGGGNPPRSGLVPVWLAESVAPGVASFGAAAPLPAFPLGDGSGRRGWLSDPHLDRSDDAPSDSPRVLLFSGGLDSFILWHLLDKPATLYCLLGHKYQKREYDTIQRLAAFCPELEPRFTTRARCGDLEFRGTGHIPFRNLALTMAAAWEGYSTIILGALAGETSRDKSRKFARDASRLLSYLEEPPLTIVLPARGMTKRELVRLFLQRFPEKRDLLRMTSSCYNVADDDQRYAGCGACIACFRRWVALSLNGIEEAYLNDPAGFPLGTVQTWGRDLWRSGERASVIRSNAEALAAVSGKRWRRFYEAGWR